MNMRRRFGSLALATAIAATALGFGGAAHAAPAQQDAGTSAVGIFQQIVNEFSRKCLIPKGNSSHGNAPIVQRTCENRVHHRWALYPTGNGYYWIVNQGSGLCLDLAANSEEQVTYGTRAQQFWCSMEYTSEQWQLINYFGTGIYLLQNRVKGLCLDVLSRSSSNDAPLQVIECKLYEPAQHFQFY